MNVERWNGEPEDGEGRAVDRIRELCPGKGRTRTTDVKWKVRTADWQDCPLAMCK